VTSITSTRIVFLNGEYLPLHQAKISVMDRSFLFGDGVYEVIPLFNKKLFRPHPHLKRLAESLRAIKINFDIDETAFINIFEQLIQRNPEFGDNQVFYIQISRGADEVRNHLFPENVEPTVFIQNAPIPPMNITELSQGAAAITVDDIRWQWCYIKSINLLPNVLFAQQAKEAGAKEAILIRDGMALEGSSSNLFIVKNGILITPPATQQILCGITRNYILELATQAQIPVKEEAISKAELTL